MLAGILCLFLPLFPVLGDDSCQGNCTNGTGVYRYSSGGRYEGQFQNGEPQGRGVYTLADGRILYRGEWKRGRPHGQGEYFLEDGRRYSGQFVDGVFEGRGTYFFPGGARYEGEFRAGYFQGHGVFFSADGSKTSGLFEKDRLIRQDPPVKPEADLRARKEPDAVPVAHDGSGDRSVAQQDRADSALRIGAERVERYLSLLRGRRVGVIANHTSVAGGQHIVTRLQHAGIDVQRVFTPEHGLDGSAGPGELVPSVWSPRFGIPVVSLYYKKKKPSRKSLRDVDILLYDVQDVGVRFYTYLSTLHYMMEACAQRDIPLVVLDRPNPNGFYVDGPVLQARFRSFVGMHPVPLVYGMTIGEYASMINGEKWLSSAKKCRLTIVPIAHYSHSTRYVPPVRPSPNLPDIQSIYLYPHLGLFEGTALSVGRGTAFPFKVFGHPDLPGSFTFVPQPGPGTGPGLKLSGRSCRGVDLRGDPTIGRPGLQLHWLLEAYNQFPDRPAFFDEGRFNQMAGGPELLQQIRAGWSEERIRESWRPALDRFRTIRKKYLLYD